MIQIQPYLFFEGRCDEAIAFYREVLGAEVQLLMRYADNPEAEVPAWLPPGSGNKVMHATLQIGHSVVMASDGMCSGKTAFNGFKLSFNVADAAAAERVFKALGEGGQVEMPLTATFWSPCFGMLVDRFGLSWMVSVPGPRT